ncbi:hypothetical protein chiPu_0017531, partial [Chiloscyllium punctatum]|nr:hypothetical protein [Chiloscyllium punctatum]
MAAVRVSLRAVSPSLAPARFLLPLWLVAAAACDRTALRPQIHSLAGSSWKIRNANGSVRLSGATVPGNVHSALLSRGVIEVRPRTRG